MSSWISIPKKNPVRILRPPPIQQNKNNVSADLNKPIDISNYPKNVKYYISGGKLGDFIHQLSIIKYNYDNFGKKGILYLADIGDKFLLDLEKTYNETKDIILKQPYIYDYQIYNNQKYDINLSKWRSNIIINTNLNWKQIFKKTYDVNWASTKWIDNLEKDISLSNTILLTHSRTRYNNNIDFNIITNLLEQNNKIYFICFDINEYNDFIIKYKIIIPVILCNNILEMAIKINSCKLLIGNLSSPLSLSFALHKECIGIIPSEVELDINLNKHLDLPFFIPVNNNDELENVLNNKIFK